MGKVMNAQCTQSSELEKWARAPPETGAWGEASSRGGGLTGFRALALRIVYTFAVYATLTSSSRAPATRRATIEEWLAIPEDKRAELLDGRIVYHALPGPSHGFTQGWVFAHLAPYNRRSGKTGGGGTAPGGWWISLEVDMVLGDIGCRPDIIGWRREKHPTMPEPDQRGVVTAVPDFICEVLSRSTALYDQGVKRAAYFHAGVPHYWIVDPFHQTLTGLERTDRGYVIAFVAGPDDLVRAAPFDCVDFVVADLFPSGNEDAGPASGEQERADEEV